MPRPEMSVPVPAKRPHQFAPDELIWNLSKGAYSFPGRPIALAIGGD